MFSYKYEKCMYNNVYFTSDTHFGSERTLKFSRRPFSSVEEMDNTIIRNWNNVVSDRDIVFHLGDFGEFSVRDRLNGHIVLVPGNYERNNPNLISEISKLKRMVDVVIMESSILIEVGDNEEVLCLCHEPSNMSEYYFNLFGHVHQLSMVKKHPMKFSKRYKMGLNVGIDIFHKPIGIEVVNFYRNAIENHYDEEVFF